MQGLNRPMGLFNFISMGEVGGGVHKYTLLFQTLFPVQGLETFFEFKIVHVM